MWFSLRSLLRVTAVRLSIIYTLIFGLVAVGIVAYMTGATVNVLRQQYQTSIDNEVKGLAGIYRRGGVSLLFRVLERRASAPGANLYAVANAQGQIVAGNVPRLDGRVMQSLGWTGKPFAYEKYVETGDMENRVETSKVATAIARVIEVPNGMRVLVGRDMGEYEGFGKVVGDAFKLAIGAMLALGLLTWFFVGRRALKRIDGVTKSSRRILSGDKTERLPITGSRDEFDRLSENLNLMLDRISTLDEGLKQMSDNIAHDLKTPITRLRNKAEEAFQLKNSKQKQQEAIGDIIHDCDQIVKTFDALMMISRVGSGSSVASVESIDLVAILNDVHELYEAVAEEDQIKLTFSLHSEKPIVITGNRELLSQAISNLLDNAIKYGAGDELNPKIELSLHVEQGQAKIIVADNGVGISQSEREKVIERFVRLDKSRNKSGNGLGLSLVEAITEFHKGELHLSNNDPGLRVTISLPLEQQELV